MGIPSLLGLLKSITTKKHIKEYKDQVVAVDVYTWLHPALFTCSYELANNIDTTKHIDFCLKRVEGILAYGIKKLVMVFDGRQLPSKIGTEENREKSREESKIEAEKLYAEGKKELAYKKFASSIDVTPQMAYEFIQAIKGRSNIECIVSPYEADAQLAFLSRTNYVDVVFSEDSDLLAFGCKRVLFKLYKGEQKDVGDEICIDNLKNCKDINMSLWDSNMFLTACIFAGCDYLPSIKRMGIQTAFKFVGENKSYKKCLYSMRSKNYEVPQNYDSKFEQAFFTFRFQFVYCPRTERIIHLNSYDLEAIKQQYVDKDQEHIMNPFNWKDFEDNILVTPLIFKLLSPSFNWDFLGDMDEITSLRVAKVEIDPETLKPYKEIKSIEGLNIDGNNSNYYKPTSVSTGGLLSLQTKVMHQEKKKHKKNQSGLLVGNKQTSLSNFIKVGVTKKLEKNLSVEKVNTDDNLFLMEGSHSLPEEGTKLSDNPMNLDMFGKSVFHGKAVSQDGQPKKRSELKQSIAGLYKEKYFYDELNTTLSEEIDTNGDINSMLNPFKSNQLISKNLNDVNNNNNSSSLTVSNKINKSLEQRLNIDRTPLNQIILQKPSLLKKTLGLQSIQRKETNRFQTMDSEFIQEEENEEQIYVDKNQGDRNQQNNGLIRNTSKLSLVQNDSGKVTSRLDEFSKLKDGEVIVDTAYLLRKYPQYNFQEKFSQYFGNEESIATQSL